MSIISSSVSSPLLPFFLLPCLRHEQLSDFGHRIGPRYHKVQLFPPLHLYLRCHETSHLTSYIHSLLDRENQDSNTIAPSCSCRTGEGKEPFGSFMKLARQLGTRSPPLFEFEKEFSSRFSSSYSDGYEEGWRHWPASP